MGYIEWFDRHAAKHAEIVTRLRARGMTTDEIVTYFDFDNMVREEPTFCPLYQKTDTQGVVGKRCHDLEPLNCYLCACPFFRFRDGGFQEISGKTQKSYCSVDSKHGAQGIYGNDIHQNCTSCTVPHRTAFVRRNFHVDWRSVMRKCSK